MPRISLQSWALASLSGLLQVLAFPIAGPVPFWRASVCWICLLPFIAAVVNPDPATESYGGKRGAALGYASGFIWYLGNCYWIYPTMHLYGGLSRPVAVCILILFCLYLSLYHALYGALLGWAAASALGRRGALLLSPFAWVAVELARSRITGLPWDLLGISQVDNPVLTRLAPVTGVYGISFVIVLVNSLWLLRVEVRDRKFTRPLLTGVGVLTILCCVLLARQLTTHRRSKPTATAVLVQENLEVGAAATEPEPPLSRLLDSFSYLSRFPQRSFYAGIPGLPGTPYVKMAPRSMESPALPNAAPLFARPDLIVWPESPAPFEERSPEFRARLSSLAQKAASPIIVGNIAVEPDTSTSLGYTLYNSASFVAPDGTFAGRYDKIHLVPFGEYVPFRKLLFFAGSLLEEVGTFSPGKNRTLFTVDGHRYGTFICYESIFGDEVRQFVTAGADVLVNISNDGWYGDSSAPWQHLNMVRMRAIENHRWVLRATNTGVTAAIDPFGRVTQAAPRHVRTSLAVRFGYEHDLTFYTRYGDWWAYLCVAVTIASLGAAFSRMQ